MSQTIKLKKGFDIRIQGSPQRKVNSAFSSATFAVKPTDYNNISPIPKLMVSVGDEVLAGQGLFFDKKNPDVIHAAPVSGEIAEIRRGAKRAISEVVILGDSNNVKFQEVNAPNLDNVSRENLVGFLLQSGVWPYIKQRPFGVIADHKDVPKNIFVSGFDSSPLAPDYSFIAEGNEAAIQAGFRALQILTDGKVYLGLSGNDTPAALKGLSGVHTNYFNGPHPAGNVGVQIHHTAPIAKGDMVWTLDLPNLIVLGRLFSEGRFNTEKLIAVGGPVVKEPGYIKTFHGANIEQVLKNNLSDDNVRVIAGNVLSGNNIGKNGHLGAFDNSLSILAEGNYYDTFGWLFPSKAKPTMSKSFLNGLFGSKKEYAVDTNTNGEKRAFVVSGQYEKVLPMDIYPVQLLKSILFNDLDGMEGLGIYEVLEEDLALCEYVCTSKNKVQEILRQGLNTMMEQG